MSLRTSSWFLPGPRWTCVAGSAFHGFSFHTNHAGLVCQNPDGLPCSPLYACVLKYRAIFTGIESGSHAALQFSLVSTARFICASGFGTANIFSMCFYLCLFICSFVVVVCAHAPHTCCHVGAIACVWRSEERFEESVLSIYIYVGCRD